MKKGKYLELFLKIVEIASLVVTLVGWFIWWTTLIGIRLSPIMVCSLCKPANFEPSGCSSTHIEAEEHLPFFPFAVIPSRSLSRAQRFPRWDSQSHLPLRFSGGPIIFSSLPSHSPPSPSTSASSPRSSYTSPYWNGNRYRPKFITQLLIHIPGIASGNERDGCKFASILIRS